MATETTRVWTAFIIDAESFCPAEEEDVVPILVVLEASYLQVPVIPVPEVYG
jgi:hypothetical protein